METVDGGEGKKLIEMGCGCFGRSPNFKKNEKMEINEQNLLTVKKISQEESSNGEFKHGHLVEIFGKDIWLYEFWNHDPETLNLELLEKRAIKKALNLCKGLKRYDQAACELLGISLSTLWRKRKKYNI